MNLTPCVKGGVVYFEVKQKSNNNVRYTSFLAIWWTKLLIFITFASHEFNFKIGDISL